MKPTVAVNSYKKDQDASSETSMDCSCEILNDTSLSNIGDSDCDCSECLEANLNAFNQFKNDEELHLMNTKAIKHNERGRSADQKLANRTLNRNGNGFKSTEKLRTKQEKTQRRTNLQSDIQRDANEEYGMDGR